MPASGVAVPARPRRSLEIDIPGIVQELGFDRNMQAVVDGVVELPEADNASELDDLRRREQFLQPRKQRIDWAM